MLEDHSDQTENLEQLVEQWVAQISDNIPDNSNWGEVLMSKLFQKTDQFLQVIADQYKSSPHLANIIRTRRIELLSTLRDHVIESYETDPQATDNIFDSIIINSINI